MTKELENRAAQYADDDCKSRNYGHVPPNEWEIVHDAYLKGTQDPVSRMYQNRRAVLKAIMLLDAAINEWNNVPSHRFAQIDKLGSLKRFKEALEKSLGC